MSFDRVAGSYRILERLAFANALQRARTALIAETHTSKHALVVGEGDGRFVTELMRVNRSIEIDCVDASGKMLALAQKRVFAIPRTQRDFTSADKGDRSRVQFHHADILGWSLPRARYDLIVTHFFLDCFDHEQLPTVIAKLERAAAPNAKWLIADFRIPSDGIAKVHAKIWLRVMYSFFALSARLRVAELVDPSPILESVGFQLHGQIFSRFGLIKSQLWQRAA